MMKFLRIFAVGLGALVLLSGLMWVGQGTGLIMWPKESFMLADSQWAINGAITALVGAAMIWWGRRTPK